jgi:hypothetical protein
MFRAGSHQLTHDDDASGDPDLMAARRHFDRALELYDRARDLPLAHIYGLDQRVAALAYLSITEHRLGRTKRG